MARLARSRAPSPALLAGVLLAALAVLAGCDRTLTLTPMGIQGRGATSPFAGRRARTTGVVTAVVDEGFFLQHAEGDGDLSTSDGVFVAGPFAPPLRSPAVGDVVTATGRIRERRFGRALPRTELAAVEALEVGERGRALPRPVELRDLPDVSIVDAIDVWEALEAMRVEVRDGVVVGPTSRFGELVVLAPEDARPGSGFEPSVSLLFVRPLGGGAVDYNPERIVVDDEALGGRLVATPGDRLERLVGVVDYAFGTYRIQATAIDVAAAPPAPPPPLAPSASGELRVATFNVENLFDTEDDPAAADEDSTPTPAGFETKLAKLARAIGVALAAPEIVAVQEIENETVLAALAARIETEAGAAYRAVALGSSDRRGIENGLLWREDRVRLVEARRLEGADIEAAFGPSSPSPGREPLLGVFEAGGRRLAVLGNHFKSKGGDDPLFGEEQPPRRPTEVQRKAQARAVRRFADAFLAADPDAALVVAGDLNDFPFPEPGEGDDDPVSILEGRSGPAPLASLIRRLPAPEAYTFLFQGNAQVLDDLLVSPALVPLVLDVAVLHANARFPAGLAGDAATALRSSDHDPVVARFRWP